MNRRKSAPEYALIKRFFKKMRSQSNVLIRMSPKLCRVTVCSLLENPGWEDRGQTEVQTRFGLESNIHTCIVRLGVSNHASLSIEVIQSKYE